MSGKAHSRLEPKVVINLADVCKSFGSRHVLEGVSLKLESGEGLCVCGANGAGKTTLIKIIATMLRASAGLVEVCGFDASRQAEEIRPLIGVVLHESMLYSQLSVVENLRFFARLYGIKNSKSRIDELLEQTRLGPWRYDCIDILSRGMVQRSAIARAMIHEPEVLLVDEPFSGLDIDASENLVGVLQQFKDNGGAFVLTTHNVGFGMRCCEHVAVLDNGRIILQKRLAEIDAGEFARDYISYARGCS